VIQVGDAGRRELNPRVGSFITATIVGLPPPAGTVAITDEGARASLLILFAEVRLGMGIASSNPCTEQADSILPVFN
jgi:hypothetical protein